MDNMAEGRSSRKSEPTECLHESQLLQKDGFTIGLLVDRGTQEPYFPVEGAGKSGRNTTTELRNECRRNGRINTWSGKDLAEPSGLV